MYSANSSVSGFRPTAGRRTHSLSLAAVMLLVAGCGPQASRAAPIEYNFQGQDDCISSPKEFARIFQNGTFQERTRCIDSSILTHIEGGFGGTAADVLEKFSDRLDGRPVTFWSAGDGPAKYLRIGSRPVVGNFIDDGDNAAADFPGIQTPGNAESFLENIGYPSPYSDISGTFALFIARAPAKDSPTPYFVPTAHNMREFYSKYLDLPIPEEAVKILEDESFSELTGCPAACVYANLLFPSEGHATPAYLGQRTGESSCAAPKGPNVPADDELVLAPPTFIDMYPDSEQCNSADGQDIPDWCCSQQWRRALKPIDEACYDPNLEGAGMKARADAVAEVFKKEFKALVKSNPKDYRQQALLWRAYMTSSCAGDFNALNTFNGITYTGFAGLMSPTSSEVVTGQPAPSFESMDIEVVYFCMNGNSAEDECRPPSGSADASTSA